MVSIVAVMGFDWRHVIRSILRIGFKRVKSVHLILPMWNDERALSSIDRIKEIVETAGLRRESVVTHRVNPVDFAESVVFLEQLYLNILPEGRMILSLGGGMRVLVIEAIIAAISLDSQWRKLIDVVVDLEGREDFVEFTAEYATLLRLKVPVGIEWEILQHGVKFGEVRVKEVSEKFKMPRSSAHKILKRMVDKRLLAQIKRGIYVPTDLAKLITKTKNTFEEKLE